MNNIDKIGWLAGIVDGEGTITITRQNRFTWFSYRPEIHITNTNFQILKTAKQLFEKISGRKVRIFSTNLKRNVYRIRLQDTQGCLKMLEVLMPHLIGKKNQAVVLLNFLSNKGNEKWCAMQAAKIHKLNLSSSRQVPQRLHARPR